MKAKQLTSTVILVGTALYLAIGAALQFTGQDSVIWNVVDECFDKFIIMTFCYLTYKRVYNSIAIASIILVFVYSLTQFVAFILYGIYADTVLELITYIQNPINYISLGVFCVASLFTINFLKRKRGRKIG